MTTLTDTLSLPAWIGDETGAHVTQGRRELSWRIHHPEVITLHRCTLVWGWFAVAEMQMWKGEPLRFSCERRQTESSGRDYFTDKARAAMADEVLPPIARYGFHRLWMDIHRRGAGGQGALDQADRHQRDAQWWRDKAELMDLYSNGLLEFVPFESRLPSGRDFKVETAAPHGHHAGWQTPAAKALLDGEHVGWMGTDGDVIPIKYPQGD